LGQVSDLAHPEQEPSVFGGTAGPLADEAADEVAGGAADEAAGWVAGGTAEAPSPDLPFLSVT